MTEALTVSGVMIRLIQSNIGPVIPVIDLADKIGYSRSSLSNIIDKNAELFEGFTIYETLETNGGPQRFLCVNSTGADRLILLMKPSKNRREIFERVEAFRAHAFGQLAESKREIVQVPTGPVLDTELQQARRIAELTGTDLKTMQAAALRKCGLPEYAEVLQQQVSSITHGEAGWHIPTQLGAMCGLTAEQLNHWLNNNPNDPERRPYQYRDSCRVWRLTELGKLHGQEYLFEAPSGHKEIRIRWRVSILYASGLKRDIPESQMALPARA